MEISQVTLNALTDLNQGLKTLHRVGNKSKTDLYETDTARYADTTRSPPTARVRSVGAITTGGAKPFHDCCAWWTLSELPALYLSTPSSQDNSLAQVDYILAIDRPENVGPKVNKWRRLKDT